MVKANDSHFLAVMPAKVVTGIFAIITLLRQEPFHAIRAWAIRLNRSGIVPVPEALRNKVGHPRIYEG